MRLGLVVSLLVHTGVVGVALFLAVPGTKSARGVVGARLEMAPRILPEPSAPPPAELAPPPAPTEPVPVVPAEETLETDAIAETAAHLPHAFRLRPVTKLATPLPVRRAARPPAEPAPSAAPQPTSRRGAPEGKLVAPRLVDAPAARYPSRARRLGWEGRVILELVVSAHGNVEKVSIASSSGHAALDRAGAEAARRWSFRPATRDGTPVAHTVRVPVDFKLVPP